MISKICNNIIDSRAWILGKVIFGICVILTLTLFFIKEYQKEKTLGFSVTNPRDIATILRNVDYYIPIAYAIAMRNPAIFISYTFISFTAVATIETCKYFIHEERPDNTTKNSFPSGHATIAFLMAHFMFLRINKIAGIFSIQLLCLLPVAEFIIIGIGCMTYLLAL